MLTRRCGKGRQQSHLYFHSCLEADAIRDGGLEVSNGVIFLFHLRRDRRFRQVQTTWL